MKEPPKKINGSQVSIIDQKCLKHIMDIKEHSSKMKELTNKLEAIVSDPPKQQSG